MLSKKKFIYPVIVLLVAFSILAVMLMVNNEEKYISEDQDSLPAEELLEGRKLSTAYCSRCHVYPEPDLLPKETWISETLPAIGPMLGIRSHDGITYNLTKTPHQPENFYPSERLISSEEWQKILDYYKYAAPEVLQPANRDPEITADSLFFLARTPDHPTQEAAVVSALKFDPGNRLIYVADANKNSFMVYDNRLELKNEYSFSTPVSDIQFLNNPNQPGKRNLLLTYMGHMNPSDAPLGSVAEGWYDPTTGEADMESMIRHDSLTRPVESQLADLNGDGTDDLLISEFGHITGRLSWLDGLNKSETERNVLIETPGCIQSHILDITYNGWADVVALCTQVDQSLYLFRNQGNGEFEKQRLIQFEITAGSTSFELHDFNDDGHLDILYTSGDNADFSQIYKPYHGVYIYLNDGDYNFTEEWFYPINGAFDAVAADFNKNGRLDIAVISYFADYTSMPEEGFLFFKNEGELTFTPYHHPAASAGRWLTMDVADWTGNGFEDILLANFSIGPDISGSPFRKNWRDGSYFLVLENKSDILNQ